MKGLPMYTLDGTTQINLAANQVFSLKGRIVQVACLQGELWITWPLGCERILKPGQVAFIEAAGKICIQAMSSSCVRICNQARAMPLLRLHPAPGLA